MEIMILSRICFCGQLFSKWLQIYSKIGRIRLLSRKRILTFDFEVRGELEIHHVITEPGVRLLRNVVPAGLLQVRYTC